MNSVSYAITAGAVAAAVAPVRAVATVRLFRAGAYAQGDLFRTAGGLHYIVMVAGNYATEPSHRSGNVGNLQATAHKSRKSLVLQNVGSVEVYFAFGDPVTVASGLKIAAGGTLSLAWIQSGVSAITAAGTSELRVAEIFE